MKNINMATMSNGARKAEVRESDDGFSVFTWSDFGGNVGVIQWRETHGLAWSDAHKIATDWVNDNSSSLE